MGLFTGQVVFITGGASGIGLATAKRLAQEGAKVAVADIDTATLDAAVTAVGHGAISVQVDVADAASIQHAVALVERHFGGLDLAVNAAGIGGPMAPVSEAQPEDLVKVLMVNLAGVLQSMRYELAAMKKRIRPAGRQCAIVNVASIEGLRPRAGLAVYAASKAGIITATSAAAAESGPDGIRVNVVCPGITDTPILPAWLDREALAKTIPLRRLGQPEQVAETIVFLLSDKASQITGANFVVDGGSMADNSVAICDITLPA